MRCYACDGEGTRPDKATGRYYCPTCTNIWMKTAYSEGFTLDEEDDTIQLYVQDFIRRELGVNVRQNAQDMS